MAVLVCKLEEAKLYGHNAAIVLSQIRFWLQKANNGDNAFVVIRSGKRWLAHSREKLCAETAFTPKQLRSAIEALKEAKMIEVEQHLFWGKNVSHFYLVETNLINSGAMGQIKPAFNDHAGIAPTVQPKLAQNGLLKYKEINEENDKENFSIDYADAISGKKEKKKKYEHIFGTSGSDACQTIEHPLTSQHLHNLFQNAMSERYPDYYIAPPSLKEWGQLKHILARSPHGKAGLILDYVVRHWQDFCSYAVADQAAFNLAQTPSIPQILQYLNSAVNLWQKAQIKPSQTPKKPKPPLTPQPKPLEATGPALSADGHPIATLEEVAEIMGLSDV